MFQIYVDGKPKFEPRTTKLRCVADILERGWFEPVERFGIVWVKGVEIRETQNVVGTSTSKVDGVS